MLILPESLKTLINVFNAIFIKKGDIPDMLTDKEFLTWLNNEKIVEPVASATGELYTTNDNKIYIL